MYTVTIAMNRNNYVFYTLFICFCVCITVLCSTLSSFCGMELFMEPFLLVSCTTLFLQNNLKRRITCTDNDYNILNIVIE